MIEHFDPPIDDRMLIEFMLDRFGGYVRSIGWDARSVGWDMLDQWGMFDRFWGYVRSFDRASSLGD
jgi:hypothetical protein